MSANNRKVPHMSNRADRERQRQHREQADQRRGGNKPGNASNKQDSR